MVLSQLVAGLVVLFLGRRIFWLFVGIIGFMVGASLIPQVMHGVPSLIVLIIAVGAGIVGAALAYFVEGLMIAVAGFLAGAYLAVMTVATTAPGMHTVWPPFLIGGAIGAVLFLLLFDWGLIVFSSLIGAGLTASALHLAAPATFAIFVALAILGIGSQARATHGRRRVS